MMYMLLYGVFPLSLLLGYFDYKFKKIPVILLIIFLLLCLYILLFNLDVINIISIGVYTIVYLVVLYSILYLSMRGGIPGKGKVDIIIGNGDIIGTFAYISILYYIFNMFDYISVEKLYLLWGIISYYLVLLNIEKGEYKIPLLTIFAISTYILILYSLIIKYIIGS